MAAIYKKPSIFLNPDLRLQEIDQNTKACDKIGCIWSRLQTVENVKDAIPLMEMLGVSKRDERAQKMLLPVIQAALQRGIQVTPSEDDSGVFFLATKKGQKFAVFKVGEKRARMEMLARQIAHRTGLEKHAIPGIACTIQSPIFPEEEIQTELFNGNVKVFRSPNDDDYNKQVRRDNETVRNPFTITGILEPFIPPNAEISKEEFLSMVIYSLIIGLRDGKLSGMAGSMLFDLEECMPQRFIPGMTPDRTVAATHLPFLEHALASEEISVEVLKELADKVSEKSLPIFNLLADLRQERVGIADLAGESFEPVDEELYDGKKKDRPYHDTGWDDGGCPVQVESQSVIMDQTPVVRVESQDAPLLTDQQLIACADRVSRLRLALEKQIQRGEPMNAIDLVCAVDPFYKAHWNALQKSKFDRQPFSHIIGRHTPLEVGRQLSKEDSDEIRLAIRSLGDLGPSPSPPSMMQDIRDPSKTAQPKFARRLFDFPEEDKKTPSS